MSETEKDAYMSGYRMGMEAVRAEKSALIYRIDKLCAEVERLRKYTRKLEVANLDVTARLQDYIGQYDPTDAFVSEVKAENAKLRELCADLFKLADESYVPFKNTNKWMSELVDIESRMRELRIEVPE